MSNKITDPIETDIGFLMWIHERLEHVHGDSRLTDFMHRFRAIISNMDRTQKSPRSCGGNSLGELKENLMLDSGQNKLIGLVRSFQKTKPISIRLLSVMLDKSQTLVLQDCEDLELNINVGTGCENGIFTHSKIGDYTIEDLNG